MFGEIKVHNQYIGKNNPAYVIAEIGRTHNNEITIMKQMIEEIANAGGDAVKIQSIEANELLVENEDTQEHYHELKKLELSIEDHIYLKEIAEENGINFLSTPESLKMVDLLENIGIESYKISSLDLVYSDLLRYVAQKLKPIFLSTGMATMDEIQNALRIIRSEGNDKIALLHCISLYPPNFNEMSLETIRIFKNRFQVVPGFSDHSLGIVAPLLSIAFGAKVIEKHFTLDTHQVGVDHKISLNPIEFTKMVKSIRKQEELLGDSSKNMSEREIGTRQYKRRKIVAAANLDGGIIIGKEDLNFKQLDSYDGIQSQFENQIVGKILQQDLEKDEPFRWDILSN